MTPADNQQEPSMEEILASIRKIIAENGEGNVKPSASANSANATKATQHTAPERIFELTDVVGKATATPNKPQSQPQQLARSMQSGAQTQQTPARPSQPQHMSQAQKQPPAPQHIQSQRPAMSQSAQATVHTNQKSRLEAEIDDNFLEQEIAELASPAISSSVPAKNQISRVPDQSVALISDETALAASAAFAELTAITKLPMGTANRTLEDLTKDLLRPLLKSWLDQNLPPLVQRLIREEIERVARNRS